MELRTVILGQAIAVVVICAALWFYFKIVLRFFDNRRHRRIVDRWFS